MKYILIFILISVKANGQIFWGNSINIDALRAKNNTKKLVWDSSKYYTLCGLDKICLIPDYHYQLLDHEADGVPIYGPQQALIGVKTKLGFFVPTRRRDHLKGNPMDEELLQDTAKLNNFLRHNL